MERRLNALPEFHEHGDTTEQGTGTNPHRSRQSRLSRGGEDLHDQHIEIAVVTFAFDNSEVINGLKKRGKFIKKEDWDLVEK